ncbi:trafficking kinesin-binding protein milt isoform X2 [Schistocerca piceifrons]|uniref:trafficking kinesin-binding protein milt isoform X2 n=1 Tax=Schistocerca piceifrons TaxID=274613 RepID=UPI001F5F62DB|nr:trafficking kinesin-binding protein milt isoform X2 [Schistocerca piceifrons]
MEHSDSGQKPGFVFHAYRHCQGCQAIKCYLDSQPAGVLCSNRVSQMTKTYNDIEAVTRLLEEKEKDLELTARIGKELLAHNQKLETNVASLEAELKAANEKLTQLSHELVKKTELIQILTNDVDESGSEGGTPTSLRCINVELMQRRIGSLEEENKQLRREASQLASDTAECESAEQRLVQDIAQQLANSSMEVEGLSEELDRCKDENRLQQDQIASLTAKLADAEQKLLKLGAENETLTTQLTVSREVQAELASELADSKDRYNEVVALLRETQEQLRKQRKRGQPTVRGCGGGPLFSTGTPQPDSLASELLETSLYSELSTDSGIGNDRGASYRKVFETVRCASRNSNSSSDSPLHVPRSQSLLMSTSTTMSSGPRVSAFAPPASAASHLQSSRYYSSSSAFPSLDSVGTAHSDYDSSLATTDTEESYPGAPRTGVPGVPGAADLEAAVRRLTPAEIIARRATLGAGPIASSDYDSHTPPNFLPYGCRTPDSIMSTGSSGFSAHSGAWRLPEKLQIVKPMEGSLTLAAWSQLATPTLGGLLEERPGVKIRGGRPLEDLGLEMYTLSDLEEDEEYENPGKSFQNTGSVYTFTNSTVLHPDDNTNVTSSVRGSQMCTAAPSRAGTAVPPTPVTRSRRNSTSTFSTTLGLAKLLNERGIRAVTPSTVCTPCSTFSPTATPCNSPDGSPRSSPPPSPPPFNPIKFPGFLTSGADFLRRTFSAEADQTSRSRKSKRVSKLALSRQEKKALSGIRLVERLESIGLDTILTTSAAAPVTPLALQGSLYTRHHLKSPMAQLTCLKTAPVVSAQEKEPSSSPKPFPALGVPARPGTGALDERPLRPPLKRQATAVRPDLGVVPLLRPQVAVGAADGPAGTVGSSALGTVSQLLFGRKGGLL